MNISDSAFPQRYAGLPVCGADRGDIACHVSLYLETADHTLPAPELKRRIFDPAEVALNEAIDRRGRQHFVGVAFIQTQDQGRPALMIAALRQR